MLTLSQQPQIKQSNGPATQPITSPSKPSKDSKGPNAADTTQATKWPVWAEIKLNGRGKSKANLLDQHSIIRAVVRKAIRSAETDIITRKAWPELETARDVYRRRLLLDAGQILAKDEVKAQDVVRRAESDSTVAAILGNMVSCLIPVWMIERSMIYQNQGLLNTLKGAFFSSKKDFGFKYMSHYKSTLPKRNEPELATPLVALAATGMSHNHSRCLRNSFLCSTMQRFMRGRLEKSPEGRKP
ncbi:hypothetical protein CVT26_015367 [Gymnopilus dilepis]|uniref:DUF6532 domain-containing protein n=1 Tax=Gymnopilus dilepis TaxID=231916 RepID=A0A409WD01_9AGAR|nr:hypothetical protein CVT26_015367 [Gymnopilus dilepis]